MWPLHSVFLEYFENNQINVINLIFSGFTLVIVFFGTLMNLNETQLPVFIRQTFRYGKHSFKGKSDTIINRMEVPKSWFRHFYIFAFVWSCLALIIMLITVVSKTEASEIVLTFLDLIAGKSRKVQTNTSCALVATILLTLQCARRFYETNFIQIFSKGKMNISHYFVGYFHYFGAIVAMLSNTEGFVRGSKPTSFAFGNLTLFQFLATIVYVYAWIQQYKTNIILINVRKDPNTGAVHTECHYLPRGAYFEFLSCPHMFFEIILYLSLWIILIKSTTWLYISLWVLSNQVVNGLLTHKWYKENFKDYPKDRFAIIPFIF